MENIESNELQSFKPNQKTIDNLNKPNKSTEFDIDVGDGFIHTFYADLYMIFEIRGRDANGEYTQTATHKDNVRLINNFVPHLFSEIRISKHGQIIDTIDYPGFTSTAVNTCKISKPEANYFDLSGWEGIQWRKTEEEILFPLRLLPGFCSDYKSIMYKGGLKFIFKRSPNDDNAFLVGKQLKKGDRPHEWDVDETKDFAHPAKLVIKSMELRIPIVTYEPNYADLLRKQMLDKKLIPISFNTYQCFEKPFSGKYLEFDLTTQFNSVEFYMPDWVICFFQTNRNTDDQKNDSSKFDHCKVVNIHFKNGRSEIFPLESLNLDFENHKYLKIYEMYSTYKRSICGNTEMYYYPKEFLENRPMFVINTSYHKNVAVRDRTNLKLTVNFQTNVPDSTICYVVLIGKKNIDYDIEKERLIDRF
jgi:hypothetical protein